MFTAVDALGFCWVYNVLLLMLWEFDNNLIPMQLFVLLLKMLEMLVSVPQWVNDVSSRVLVFLPQMSPPPFLVTRDRAVL